MKKFVKDFIEDFDITGEPELKQYKESEYYLLDEENDLCISQNGERQLIFAYEATMKRSLRLKNNGGSSLADKSDLMKVCDNGRSKGSFWLAGTTQHRDDVKAIMIKCDVKNYNMDVAISVEANKFVAESAEKAFSSGAKGFQDLIVVKEFSRKENLITISLSVNISKMDITL